MDPSLSQSLHLINGDTVQNKIASGAAVKHLIEKLKDPARVVEELYVRCLSRPPTPDEAAKLRAALADSPQPRPALEDVLWALLNSKEFMFNH